MAKYTVNPAGVAKCRALIEAKQYVLDSDWGNAQPKAEDENAFLKKRSWEEYGAWHLGLTEGANDETPYWPDRLRLPRRGVAAQEGRTGSPRAVAAAGLDGWPD